MEAPLTKESLCALKELISEDDIPRFLSYCKFLTYTVAKRKSAYVGRRPELYPHQFSIQNITDLYIKQKGYCSISGIKMTYIVPRWWVMKSEKKPGTSLPQYNDRIVRRNKFDHPYNISVDRIDDTEWYRIGNVHLTTQCVNFMRGLYNIQDYVDVCMAVAGNNAHITKTDNLTIGQQVQKRIKARAEEDSVITLQEATNAKNINAS